MVLFLVVNITLKLSGYYKYYFFLFLSWFCHVDDDVYVIVDNLIKLLSMMDPKTEARYIGKALTPWKRPYAVSSSVYMALKCHKYNYDKSFQKMECV